jgi:HEAT repeat protein
LRDFGRTSRSLLALALLVLYGHVPATAPSAEAGAARDSIEWQDQRLSVSVDGMPLGVFVALLAARIGVQVDGIEHLDGTISIKFMDLPLREALERILAHTRDYVMIETQIGDDERSLSIVLRFWPRTRVARAVAETVKAQTDAAVVDPERTPALETDLTALVVATSHPDQEVRETAIGSLAGVPSRAATVALKEVLGSPDRHVQLRTVDALFARGPDGLVAVRAFAAAADDIVRRYIGELLQGVRSEDDASSSED